MRSVRLKVVNKVAHHMANRGWTRSASPTNDPQCHTRNIILPKKALAVSRLTRLFHKSPPIWVWSKLSAVLPSVVLSWFPMREEGV